MPEMRSESKITARNFDSNIRVLHKQLASTIKRNRTKERKLEVDDHIKRVAELAGDARRVAATAKNLRDPRLSKILCLAELAAEIALPNSQSQASRQLKAGLGSSSPIKEVVKVLWLLGKGRAGTTRPEHLSRLIWTEFLRLKLESDRTPWKESEPALSSSSSSVWERLVDLVANAITKLARIRHIHLEALASSEKQGGWV